MPWPIAWAARHSNDIGEREGGQVVGMRLILASVALSLAGCQTAGDRATNEASPSSGAELQKQLAALPGQECSGRWQSNRAAGRLTFRFDQISNGKTTGQVVNATNSGLPYPHDFWGTVDGHAFDLQTDHGEIDLKMHGARLSGQAIIYENPALDVGRDSVTLELMC